MVVPPPLPPFHGFTVWATAFGRPLMASPARVGPLFTPRAGGLASGDGWFPLPSTPASWPSVLGMQGPRQVLGQGEPVLFKTLPGDCSIRWVTSRP